MNERRFGLSRCRLLRLRIIRINSSSEFSLSVPPKIEKFLTYFPLLLLILFGSEQQILYRDMGSDRSNDLFRVLLSSQ